MGYILWIILGYIIGWIAPDIMRADTHKSMILYLFLGIFGSLVGGYVTSIFLYNDPSNIHIFSIIVASIGSIGFMQFGKGLIKV